MDRTDWTEADDGRAEREGWAIMNEDTGECIQRDDALAVFVDDCGLHYHLTMRARCGDDFARRALRLVAENNPTESYARLMELLDDTSMEDVAEVRALFATDAENDAAMEDEPGVFDEPGATPPTPPPGRRYPITSAESQRYIDEGYWPRA
jgi:hypothetical protein